MMNKYTYVNFFRIFEVDVRLKWIKAEKHVFDVGKRDLKNMKIHGFHSANIHFLFFENLCCQSINLNKKDREIHFQVGFVVVLV